MLAEHDLQTVALGRRRPIGRFPSSPTGPSQSPVRSLTTLPDAMQGPGNQHFDRN
jgi:hypothetical protein